jgi:hypothetical protein
MKFYGKYKGICRDIHDPKMRGRIRAEIPAVLGRGLQSWSSWAEPCLQANSFQLPEEGDGVWVEFEGGNPSQPIWSGIWYKGAGRESEAIFQEIHEPLRDWDDEVVDRDKEDHSDPTDIDDVEHREYHDHRSNEFYDPHRFGWQSHTGHVVEFNDHPGRDAYLRVEERRGRLLEFLTKGLSRLRGFLVTESTGFFQDLDGTDVEAAHTLLLADYANEEEHGTDEDKVGYISQSGSATSEEPLPAKWYVLLRDMAGGFLRLVSDPGKESIRLGDFWGQYLQINSIAGEEYIELLDKKGQYIRFDAVAGTVEVSDEEGNTALFEQGKITLTAVDGHIILNVPSGKHVHIGGESGEELATKTFVQAQYNTHTHISGSPGTPTSPPMTPSPLVPGNDITKKCKSE